MVTFPVPTPTVSNAGPRSGRGREDHCTRKEVGDLILGGLGGLPWWGDFAQVVGPAGWEAPSVKVRRWTSANMQWGEGGNSSLPGREPARPSRVPVSGYSLENPGEVSGKLSQKPRGSNHLARLRETPVFVSLLSFSCLFN